MIATMEFGESINVSESLFARRRFYCKTMEVRRRSVVACGGGGR